MKKLFLLGLCLLAFLIPEVGMAAETQVENHVPLTYAELLNWRDAVWQQTRQETVLNDPTETYDAQGAGTYLIQLQSYTIESSQPSLDVEDNPILSVTMNDMHAQGPRGTGLGLTIDDVLSTYQNDNPLLTGNQEFATLYVYELGTREDLPEAAWGLLMRNEFETLSVEYAVCAPFGEADSFTEIIVSFIIDDGYVTDMRVRGFGASILEKELQEDIAVVREIASSDTYLPLGGMQPQTHPTMFEREDLLFSGLDFLTQTAEDVRTLLGKPTSEEIVTGEDGGKDLLQLVYPGLQFDFAVDEQKKPTVLLSMVIQDPNFSGPREVRIGDKLTALLAKFRLEEQTYQEPQTILYAPGESIAVPPFGLLEIYSEQEATVRYAMPAPGDSQEQAIMLHVTVESLHVTEVMLYRWQVEE